MKTLIGQVLGTWLAWGTVAVFLRLRRPTNTGIRCAWCGDKIPTSVADEGGIGAVNHAMRDHMFVCESHPMQASQRELIAARLALKNVRTIAERALSFEDATPGLMRMALREIEAIVKL